MDGRGIAWDPLFRVMPVTGIMIQAGISHFLSVVNVQFIGVIFLFANYLISINEIIIYTLIVLI